MRDRSSGQPALDPVACAPRYPRIILATSTSHMPRARSLSAAGGARFVPLPGDFRIMGPVRVRAFISTAVGLEDTQIALHKIRGHTDYWLHACAWSIDLTCEQPACGSSRCTACRGAGLASAR